MNLFGMRRKKLEEVCCLSLSPFGIAHLYGKPPLSVANQASSLLTISHAGFEPYPNPYPDEKMIASQLKKIARQENYRNSTCLVVLSSDYYRLLLIDLPTNVEDKELNQALPWMVKDLIDYPVDEALLSFFPVPGRQGEADKLYVAIAKQAILKSLQQQLIAAEFNVVCIDIAEMAMHYILTRLDQNSQGAALLFLNDNDQIIVTSKGSTFYLARSMDQGLSHVSQDDRADIFGLEIRRFLDYAQLQMDVVEQLPLFVAGDKTATLKQLLTTIPNRSRFIDLAALFDLPQSFDLTLSNQCLLAFGGMLRTGELS